MNRSFCATLAMLAALVFAGLLALAEAAVWTSAPGWFLGVSLGCAFASFLLGPRVWDSGS